MSVCVRAWEAWTLSEVSTFWPINTTFILIIYFLKSVFKDRVESSHVSAHLIIIKMIDHFWNLMFEYEIWIVTFDEMIEF